MSLPCASFTVFTHSDWGSLSYERLFQSIVPSRSVNTYIHISINLLCNCLPGEWAHQVLYRLSKLLSEISYFVFFIHIKLPGWPRRKKFGGQSPTLSTAHCIQTFFNKNTVNFQERLVDIDFFHHFLVCITCTKARLNTLTVDSQPLYFLCTCGFCVQVIECFTVITHIVT